MTKTIGQLIVAETIGDMALFEIEQNGLSRRVDLAALRSSLIPGGMPNLAPIEAELASQGAQINQLIDVFGTATAAAASAEQAEAIRVATALLKGQTEGFASEALTARNRAVAAANEAESQIVNLADDSLLTKHEKITVLIPQDARLEASYDVLDVLAAALGITTERTAAANARTGWITYRNGLDRWNDVTIDTPVIRNDLRAAVGSYADALEELGAKIAGQGGITGFLTNDSFTVAADSSGVVGSFAGAGGTFKIYEGLTAASAAQVVFSVLSETGVDVSIDVNGVYAPSSMSATTGTAVLRAVYKGVTIDKEYSITKAPAGAMGAQGPAGQNAKTGFLTNEAHTVAAATDGSGYSLTGAGGTFKVFDGTADVTAASAFAISGGVDGGTTWSKTQNGLTLTINETTGAYSLSGTTWMSDAETFTLTATHGGVTISKEYSISKSRAGATGSTGATGAAAKTLIIISDRQTIAYDSAGAPTPAAQTIGFTAQKQNTSAVVNWTVTDVAGTARTPVTDFLSAASGDNVTMSEAQFASARNGTSGVIVTGTIADGSTISDKISVVRVAQGATGATGAQGAAGLSSAQVLIYKRSATAPALPTVATTYTFATGDLTGLDNGWSRTPPAGSDPLYVSVATASGTAATDSIAANEWAAPVVHVENGSKTATVYLYKRTTTSATPALPTTASTYTFSTGALTGQDNGWTQTIPAASGGAYLWITQATALGTGATDTIAATEWAAASIMARSSDGMRLEASAAGFTFTDGASDGAVTSITFTATSTDTGETINWSTSPAVTLAGTGNTRTLSLADFGANRQVVVTATGATTGNKDVVGVVRIEKSTAAAGATVGGDWGSNVANRPANLAELAGGEGIRNALVTVNEDGTLGGAGAGQVAALKLPDAPALSTNAQSTSSLFFNQSFDLAKPGTTPARPAGPIAMSADTATRVDTRLGYVGGVVGGEFAIGVGGGNGDTRVYLPMFRLNPKSRYRCRGRVKAASATTSGLYIHWQEHDGEPGTKVNYVAPFIDASGEMVVATRGRSTASTALNAGNAGIENAGLTASYQDFSIEIAPTSTAKFASIQIMRWSGMAGVDLHFENIVIEEIAPASLADLDAPVNTKVAGIADNATVGADVMNLDRGLRDFVNLVADPDFSSTGSAAGAYWTVQGGGTVDTSADTTGSAGLNATRSVKTNAGNGTTSQANAVIVHQSPSNSGEGYSRVETGRTYRVAADLLFKSGYTGRLHFIVYWYNQALASVGSTQFYSNSYMSAAAAADTKQIASVLMTAPAGAHFARIYVSENWSTTLVNAGFALLAKPRILLAADADLIKAGSVTDSRLAQGQNANIVRDPYFADPLGWSTPGAYSEDATIVKGAANLNTVRAVKAAVADFASGAGILDRVSTYYDRVDGSNELWVRAAIRALYTPGYTGRLLLFIYGYDEAGTVTTYSSLYGSDFRTTANGTSNTIEVIQFPLMKFSASTVRFRIRVAQYKNTTLADAGEVYLADPQILRGTEWSTETGGDAKPADYAGTSVTGFSQGTDAALMKLRGNRWYRESGTGWDASIVSYERFNGACNVQFKSIGSNLIFIAGLTGDAAVNNTTSYTPIDYGFHAGGSTIYAYESGVQQGPLKTGASGAEQLELDYDETAIRYKIDGVVVRTVATTAGRSFRFMVAPNTAGGGAKDIMFQRGAITPQSGKTLIDSTGAMLEDRHVRNIDLRLNGGGDGSLYLVNANNENIDTVPFGDVGASVDVLVDGTTYKRYAATERTRLDAALDGSGYVQSKVLDEAVIGTSGTETALNLKNRASRHGTDGRQIDGRAQQSNRNYGIRSLLTAPTMSSTDDGTTASISLSASSYLTDWGTTINLPTVTFSGLAFATKYYIWRNQPDPETAGSDYGISTALSNAIGPGKSYLAYYTTVNDGGTGGGGGTVGSNDCVDADAWVLLEDGSVKRARDVVAGDRLVVLDYESLDGLTVATVRSNRVRLNETVRLTTASGVKLTEALNTPITLRNGALDIAANAWRHLVPAKDKSGFRWEQCVNVEYTGEREVANIDAGGATYAAGDDPDCFILTHNVEAKP